LSCEIQKSLSLLSFCLFFSLSLRLSNLPQKKHFLLCTLSLSLSF
jgi:hypothetical protein